MRAENKEGEGRNGEVGRKGRAREKGKEESQGKPSARNWNKRKERVSFVFQGVQLCATVNAELTSRAADVLQIVQQGREKWNWPKTISRVSRIRLKGMNLKPFCSISEALEKVSSLHFFQKYCKRYLKAMLFLSMTISYVTTTDLITNFYPCKFTCQKFKN